MIWNAGVLLYCIPSTYLSMYICASPRAINQSIITRQQMAPKISLMAPLHHCIRVFFQNGADPHQDFIFVLLLADKYISQLFHSTLTCDQYFKAFKGATGEKSIRSQKRLPPLSANGQHMLLITHEP